MTGEQIRLLRTTAGLSLDELAGMAGSSKSYISRVENGKATPKDSWVRHIASVIAAYIATAPKKAA